MVRRRVNWSVVIGAVAVFLLVILLPLLGWFAQKWTDYLWYLDLGQGAVFWTRIVSQLVIGGGGALIAFVIVYANLFAARRLAPRALPISLPLGVPPQFAEIIERARRWSGPVLDKIALGVSAWIAFLAGTTLAADWEPLRLATQGATFGTEDPTFGLDIGFYLFSLPALDIINGWLFGLLLLATLLTIVVHIVDGAIQPWASLKGFAPHVKAHLSVLAALIVASRAFSYWLATYHLNYSPRGQVTGASYTDVYAQLPAYRILIVVSLVAAVALLLNIRYRGWRLPLVVLGVWVLASILVGGVYPAIVQRFVVAPNELTRETPFMAHNIRMTRLAFNLTDVEGQPFPATETLTQADVRAADDTLANVRLWDPDVVKQSYAQLQTIRPYYDFGDVDVDRYEIDGKPRQVLVSAREMNSSLLAEQAQTWQNRHLVYTHGFGLVMSPTSEFDSRGLPRFHIGDIPPRISSRIASTSPDLRIDEPRLYFGEDTTDYVVVGPKIVEFDYPQGEKNATSQYAGEAGVEVGSLLRRAAWALRLGSSQLLFSEYVTPDSKVLMKRDLTTRLNELAPWLTYEDDPYPVLVDGRVLWIVDAYTTSDMFPYAEPLASGVNYIRNSVKVTVDAYSGETRFYAFDEQDPVLKAWRGVFPTLITPGSEIPDGVRAHFRYPQGLFSAQAEMYRTYHMTDVGVFYNKEDQWEIPGVRQGTPMEPFFVLLRLPGESRQKFYLFEPYTPRNRDNLIGWMAASCDPEDFGKRTVFLLPKDRVVLGPEQVSARINQDAVIAQQLTLWNQRGSAVQFGNMLIIPIKDALVYVQPLFLRAEQTAMPELTRVVVAYSDKVVMERDLETALLRVFGDATVTPSTPTTPAPGGGGTGTPSADAAEAQRLYTQAIEAQKRGDWAEYGRLIEELGRVLSGLAGAETTATP